MLDTPQFIQTDEQLTAVIDLIVPRAEISNVMGPAIAEIMSVIAAQGVTLTGPCFSYHRKRPADIFDFEVGFPVSRPITPVGRVKMSKLPAAKVVRTIYQGGYEGLGQPGGSFVRGLKPRNSMYKTVYGNAICQVLSSALIPINDVPNLTAH
ncbi:MAG: GyrI-like domain-containing protein [Methylobacter sp.]|nr:GyrI-like domain-containing protein [Methylobacter sp.]